MPPFIHQYQSAIAELCLRYWVQWLEVLGSAARRIDFALKNSDADFLVEFSPSADSPTLKAFLDYKLTCRKSWGAPLIWRNLPPCATPMSKPTSIEAARSSMQCDPRAYLWDAREDATAILEFVTGKTFESYASNRMLCSAVDRQFESIGEALNQFFISIYQSSSCHLCTIFLATESLPRHTGRDCRYDDSGRGLLITKYGNVQESPVEEFVGSIDWLSFVTTRFILTIVFVLITPTVNALDSISLNVGTIAGSQWKLEGINIALTDLTQKPQKLALTITQLSLPKPFNDLNLANIRCTAFTWQNKELLCKQGRAEMRSKRWQSPVANFSFQITEKHSSFKLTDLHLAGGTVAVDGEERDDQWQVQINAKAVDSKLIQQLLPQERFKLKAGKINVKLNASGSHALVKEFTLTTELNGLTGQTKDGRIAAEALILEATLSAKNIAADCGVCPPLPLGEGRGEGIWQWQSHADFNGGALYAEPLYLEVAGQNIILDAQGDWDVSNKRVEIRSASYQHSKVGELSGSATVQYKDGASIEKAEFSLSSDNLQDLSAIYLKPFFEQTVLQGASFAGHLKADFSINEQSLTALTATFNNLDVKDAAGRGEIQGGVGQLNWSNEETFSQPSEFSWQQLQVRAMPIGPAVLSFLSRADSIRLLKKTQLPLLGGAIAINQFSWQAKKQQDPKLSFEGEVSNVSLEQLSLALNWTPLSGTISGYIPRVEYSNKTLSLGGELIVKVFDGEVKISNLTSSGLFTGFPKFHSDLEIDNLDLDQLTGKFKFGGITGKLSGYVRQLYMENWHPVTFFAWLGTPQTDNSRHRISQKAVQNIANIGGGGAADLLSKSFLRFFETFGYDKLGLGCYLHDGVCQLMGVKATESGYAIITGGGLPRIDVIGYNPRVDWNVLMDRLRRISTSEASVSY